MTPLRPGWISNEAKDALATIDGLSDVSTSELSITEIRKRSLDEYRPAIEYALTLYDVTYSDTVVAGIDCMIVRPQNPHPTRQILYCFGGGFVQGSPYEELPITAALAVKTGATITVPYYRLAPEHPFPAGLDDIHSVALDLFAKNPRTLLVGESAGGNLALGLCMRMRKQGAPLPPAIVALSPVTDLQGAGDSEDADRDPFLRAARVPEILSSYIDGHDVMDPEISPIYGTFDASFPTTLITSGTRDLLLSGCVRLARIMREQGAPIDLRIWEGMWHVFEFYPDIPEAAASLTEIAEFLEPHF